MSDAVEVLKASATYSIDRHFGVRVKCFFSIAMEDSLQTSRICKSEDPKPSSSNTISTSCLGEGFPYCDTHVGVDEGAQTTANDSGSMHWKPECVCKSTEDMKPTRERLADINVHQQDTHKTVSDVYESEGQI